MSKPTEEQFERAKVTGEPLTWTDENNGQVINTRYDLRDKTWATWYTIGDTKEKEPTLAEIIKANDELFNSIMLQLDAVNSEIQTINITLKSLQYGLTLEEAKEHCRDPETSSRTCSDEKSEEVGIGLKIIRSFDLYRRII